MLTPLVREYITGLMRVQQGIRKKLETLVAEDDPLLQLLIERYQSEAEEKIIGLAAVERLPNRTYGRTVFISTNVVDRRKRLERKNRGAGELTKLIVTSE